MIAWLKARAKIPACIEADREADRLTVLAIRKYLGSTGRASKSN